VIRPGTLIRWNAIRSLLKKYIIQNITVLDIGAFDGFTLGELSKEIDFIPLLLDIDIEGLKIAKKRKIHPLFASGICIPLKDNSIEVVLCLDVIEHIHENRTLISEITRIVKEDGIIILTTPIANKKFVLFMNTEQTNKLHIQWGHVKPGYTLQELQNLFDEVNLEIEFTSQYFNIINRYLYYILFKTSLPIPKKIKKVIFKTGLYSEKFMKIGCFEHIIVAKKIRK